MVLMGRWVLAHEHFTLRLQLTVICSSLVGALVVKGAPLGVQIFLDFIHVKSVHSFKYDGISGWVTSGSWTQVRIYLCNPSNKAL